MTARSTADPDKRRIARFVPLFVIALVALAGIVFLRDVLSFETLRENREQLLGFRDSNYAGLMAIFAAIYIAMVVFSLPGATVASMTGGFLFGLWAGTAVNVIAATSGAVGIFWAVRLGLGASLTRRIDGQDLLRRWRRRLQENEISVLLLLRLVTAVPFFVANILPALVPVRAWNFVWTTALGIVPGAFVYTSVGVGLGEVFDRGGTPDLSLLWEPQVIVPIIGLSFLAALPIMIKARRAARGAAQ